MPSVTRRGQPLVPGLRLPRLSLFCGFAACAFFIPAFLRRGADHVLRPAGNRDGVVDARDLGHPLAVFLLPGRQPRSQLVLRRLGGFRGRGPQRPQQHHDALAVEREDQRAPVRRVLDPAPGVKLLHVRGPAPGQFLDLPFPDLHAGRAGDCGARALHRAARRLDRGEFPQPVRVLLLRQVQHRVRRVHIAPPRRPVRDPRHPDLAEHRHQRPGPASFRSRTGRAVLPGHVMPPFLAGRREVQPVLEQPAQQLPSPLAQLFFQVSMLQPCRFLRRHPAGDLPEALPRLDERPVFRRRVPLHRAPSFSSGPQITRNAIQNPM
jgi:hypothetical protein